MLTLGSLEGHISCIEQLLEILKKVSAQPAALISWFPLVIMPLYTQRILDISVFSTSRVMTEFDIGGNVRLEEGKQSDLWFRSCAELVNSRFMPQVRQQ